MPAYEPQSNQPSVSSPIVPGLPTTITHTQERFEIPLGNGAANGARFELVVRRLGKEVCAIEIVDGFKSWRKYMQLSESQQVTVRSIARTLRETSDLNRVNIDRLREALVHTTLGTVHEDLFKMAVDALSAGVLPTGEIPVSVQLPIFLAAKSEVDGFTALRGTFGFKQTLPGIARTLLAECSADKLLAVIGSIGKPEQVLLGGIPELQSVVGRVLCDFLCYPKGSQLIVNKAGITALAERLSSFGQVGSKEVRDYLARRIANYSDWPTYFEFARALPQNQKLPFQDIYNDLSKMPKHRHPERTARILEHLDLFNEREWKEILQKLIPEGEETDFRKIPLTTWPRVSQEHVAEILSDEFGEVVVRENISFFNALSVTVAKKMWSSGNKDFVLNNLRSFTDLPVSMAMDASEGLYAGRVLASPNSFDWKSGEFGKFFEKMGSNRLPLMLENLDTLPPHLLADIESSHYLMEYRNRVGIPSVKVHNTFCRLKRSGDSVRVNRLVEEVKEVTRRMISSEPHDEKFIKHPIYDEIAEAVFPSHGFGHMHPHFAHLHDPYLPTNMLSGIRNIDRSARINAFKIEPKYLIDLSEGVGMVLRDGKTFNVTRIDQLQQPVEEARVLLENCVRQGKSPREILGQELLKKSDKQTLESTMIEDFVVIKLLDALTGSFPVDQAWKLLMYYHVLTSPDEQLYLEGTRDRASQARNRDYAYLLILREFFGDRIGDTTDRIAPIVMQGANLPVAVPKYYRTINDHRSAEQRKITAARAQVDKLGVTPGLLNRIHEILVNPAIKSDKRYKIIRNIIEAEQRKVAAVQKDLSKIDLNPEKINLYDFSPESFTSAQIPNPPATLDKASYKAFLRQSMRDFLKLVTTEVDGEIAKFRPEKIEDGKALRLEAYFTMNHASVLARRVAGVCVMMDWPGSNEFRTRYAKVNTNTQWDLPNYFQLVLRDPVSFRCEGLVMLHYYEDEGRKILSASFNPTSTYLFKVNGRELFQGLLNILIQFAEANQFDRICCSKNPTIRTNRTGGRFELAMNERIKDVNQTIVLGAPANFSFTPEYKQQEFDVLWVKK